MRMSLKEARRLGIEIPKTPRKKRVRETPSGVHEIGKIQTLAIPGFHPVSVNTLLSLHYFSRSKVKRSQQEIVGFYAREQKIEPAAGKRLVSIVCKGWRQGGIPDEDNIKKVLLDNLASLGLLVDDSPKWCHSVASIERSKEWETIVALENI